MSNSHQNIGGNIRYDMKFPIKILYKVKCDLLKKIHLVQSNKNIMIYTIHFYTVGGGSVGIDIISKS